jgi:hypothetical protein
MYVSRSILRVVLTAVLSVAFSQARGPFSTSTIAKRSSLKSSSQAGMTSTSPASLTDAAAALRKPKPSQPYSPATLKTGAGDSDSQGTTATVVMHGLFRRTAKIGFYFALYYALSIYYNSTW